MADEAQAREEELRDRALDAIRSRLVAMKPPFDGVPPDCVDCGEEIPAERRDAVPNATRCAPCQTRYERTHRR